MVGVKTEQSLRDTVREILESDSGDGEWLELAPSGRKDWIAGRRLKDSLTLGELEEAESAVLRRLISLSSRQRIRRESMRLWALPQPVPVFKDPVDDAAADRRGEEGGAGEETAVCPVCQRTVHVYNILRDGAGEPVGCFLCGGVRRGPRA